eukprot:4373603-Karenia_brevis.AAC.1
MIGTSQGYNWPSMLSWSAVPSFESKLQTLVKGLYLLMHPNSYSLIAPGTRYHRNLCSLLP